MKKFFIALMGGTVLVIGLAMLVLPGPGLPIIVAGLAILGTQFLWARRAMRKAKSAVAKVRRTSGFREWLRPQKARLHHELPRREHAGRLHAQGQAAQRLGSQARHRL